MYSGKILSIYVCENVSHDYAKSIGIKNYISLIKESFDSFVIKFIKTIIKNHHNNKIKRF